MRSILHHPFRLVGTIALMHDAHTKYKNTEYTKKAELVDSWRTIDDEDVATIPRIRLDMQ